MRRQALSFAALFLTVGCPAEDDPMGGSESSASTATDATDPAPTNTGDTDTQTEGDAFCQDPLPELGSQFSVDLEAWAAPDPDYRIDEACTIDAIAVAEATTVELTCSTAGGDLPVAIEFDTQDRGNPSWPLGSDVTLSYRYVALDLGSPQHALTIRDSTGDLLLAAAETGGFTLNELNSVAVDIAPIASVADDTTCPAAGFDNPMRVEFELASEQIVLASGEVDVLPRPGSDELFSVDLNRAVHSEANGDGPPQWISLLVVRVSP